MADIDKTLSELGTSVKIEGPDQEVELEKQERSLKCCRWSLVLKYKESIW